MANDLIRQLAARLHDMRKARGMTLDQLAEVSGVSRAALSRLENAEISPSLDVLAALAQAYGMSLSRLAALVDAGFAAAIRRDEQPVQRGENGAPVRRIVSPGAAGLAGEVVEMRFPGGAVWSEPAPAVPGQERHIVVIKGTLTLEAPEGTVLLDTGDSYRLRLHGALKITTARGKRAKILMFCVAP